MRPHLPAVRRGGAHYSRWQPVARALARPRSRRFSPCNRL